LVLGQLMWMGSTEEPVADCTVDVGSSVLVTVTELLAGTGAVCHDLDDCSIVSYLRTHNGYQFLKRRKYVRMPT
jgi:hypothetical protein